MPSRTLSCLLLGVGALAAQSLPPGYTSDLLALPPSASNVLHLRGASVVWFDGSALLLQDGTAPPRQLLQLPPTFGAFLIAAGPARLLFGDSGSGDLWLVPLAGSSAPRLVATLPYCYDAVLLSPHQALVSARTGGYGASANDLIAVDLRSGSTRILGQIAGASGPLAVDARGTLFYATASPNFPPPPGGAAILGWSHAAVQQALRGTAPLDASTARTLANGIDTASDLAVDSDGDLLFVDWWRGVVGSLAGIEHGAPVRRDLIDYGTAGLGAVTLQFAPPRRGVFEPYQPASGGTLWVHESSYGVLSQLRSVQPARPTLGSSPANPVPAGPFTLTAHGGPPLGLGVVAVGATASPHELAVQLPGFEQPLWLSLGLWWPYTLRVGHFDAAGDLTLSARNPGIAGHGASFGVQALVLDPLLPAIGSSSPLHLQLGL